MKTSNAKSCVSRAKGTICLLLATLCLLPALIGCTPLTSLAAGGGAGDICALFYDYIHTERYDAAYSLISDEVAFLGAPAQTKSPDDLVPEATAVPVPEGRVDLALFKDKYTKIFEAVGMEGYGIAIGNVSAHGSIASVDYQLTYQTSKGGILNYPSCTMQLRRQGGQWKIIWSPALIFPMMDWGDTVLQGVLQPKRGEIFAADGELLAKNTDAVTIFCVPSKIPLGDGYKPQFDVKTLFSKLTEEEYYTKLNSPGGLLESEKKLGPLKAEEVEEKARYENFWNAIAAITELELTPENVRDSLSRTYRDFTKIKTLFPDQLTPELEERLTDIPGIGVDKHNFGSVREYPYGTLFGHITGYAGIIQYEYIHEKDRYGKPSELYLDDPFYDGDSWLGYAGLEEQYEKILRGEKGAFAYIQGKGGKTKSVLFAVPARDGEDLHLTLRPYMQDRVKEVYNMIVQPDVTGINGAVLIMNPKTGEIYASYSHPGYDPNKFTRGEYGLAEWVKMKNNLDAPLHNRNFSGLYTPGSTFKILTAAVALESGAVTLDDEFPSTERVREDAWYPMFKNGDFAYTGIDVIRRTGNSNRHTPMNMMSSLIDSDNIYFSWCALRMGWDAFRWYLEKDGMTTAIPFDMKVAKPQIKKAESEATYPLLAMSGYGQGELMVSPLQMACYAAAYANGGKVPLPYIIAERWQAIGTDYVQTYEHTIGTWKTIATEENAAAIAKMMVGVCKSRYNHGYERGGTGKDLGVTSFIIAGKTGTAEKGKKPIGAKDSSEELAWFIGFRYSKSEANGGGSVDEDEERLVLVMLEIDMNKKATDWAMMKFKIAQALLKDDLLTEPPKTKDSIVSSAP